MQAPSPGSPATHRRGGRVWLWVGLLWCVLATAMALWQPPGPVTSNVAVSRSDRSLWDWWQFPVERNAFQRLSDVSGRFASMAIDASGQRWWLVGDAGTIAATDDAGGTWWTLSVGNDGPLTAVHASSDGQRLWVIGERGTIIASDDGGRHWRTQKSGTDRLLRAIWFASNARVGWAVGEEGTALSTEDGGTTWHRMVGLGTSRLNDVHFDASGRTGVIVGDRVAYLSQDGGRVWRIVKDDSPPSTSANPVQSNVGARLPIRTPPFESTTTLQDATYADPLPPALQARLEDRWISAFVTENGLRVGVAGSRSGLVWSDDAGQSWSAPVRAVVSTLAIITFSADGRRGAAVNLVGDLSVSEDGGKTWNRRRDKLWPLVSIEFDGDGRRAWMLGEDGDLKYSQDGGRAWSPATKRALDALTSVGFSEDGNRGWVLGANGVVLRTEDAGETWHQQSVKTAGDPSADLKLLHVSADGLKAWAMDVEGERVLQTANGGASWEPGNLTTPDAQAAMARPRQSLQPPMPLPWGVRAGYIGADGLRGWAAGDGGLLLTTVDGGRNWADPRSYARYPAPWYWLALLLSVPMFLRAWRLLTQARQAVTGMADTPATDAALTDPRQDRLNFEPLAAGISRFLRNPATEPPLTLAITGDWGSGKSSLMGLICADLRKHGSRPIWFNAWHHQKEDHLFAALLGALSKQALPPWLSLDGVGFRLRLLWMRSRKHWVFTLLLCMAAAFIVTLHAGMNDPAAETQMLRRVGQAMGSLAGQAPAKGADASSKTVVAGAAQGAPPLPWAEWLALLTVAGTMLAALRKALTAFGADPAALLAGGLQGMKPRLAAEQNSFRTRFAEQFGEVSHALPERVVVVIDDLDRCRPEAVLEIMEAVNFLTSSGQCFVLFGMATDKVQAALAIAFERIAKELASASAPDANPEQAAREQRRAYAANYLQKLINLEIKVPTAQSYEAWRLLTDDPATTAPSSWRREAMQGLRRHAMWLALSGAIAGGVSLGVLLRPQTPSMSEAQDLARASASTATSGPASAPIAGAGATNAASAPAEVSTPGLTASDATRAWGRTSAQSETRVLLQSGADSHADEWIVAGVLAAGVALAVGLFLRIASRRHREATDSKDFRDALKVWTELVRESAHTPRAVKRFGNKLRYFEMLQQGEARDRTLLEEARAYWIGLLGRNRDSAPAGDAPRAAAANRRIAAPQLVALGALHETLGGGWLKAFRAGMTDTDAPGTAPSLADDERVTAIVEDLARQHQAMFDTTWPPTAAEIDVFARLLDGIRMPGESEELDMRRSFENSAAANAEPSSASTLSAPPSSRRPDVA
jgi:photosystem II stability/assembly factor-like uncharacterized protein